MTPAAFGACLFCGFWFLTLGDGALRPGWYQFRTVVVVVYALVAVRPGAVRLLTGPESLAQTIVVLHFFWLFIHFLYGDRRMRRFNDI